MQWLKITGFGPGDVLQMFVLYLIFYYILMFFRGTRGAQVLLGFVVLLVSLLGLTQVFHMDELNWLLRALSVFFPIAVLVIFQPEIRRALAELGKQPVFSGSGGGRFVCDPVVQAVELLAERRIGALVAIEQDIGTRAIQETGVRLDGRVAPELLASIFFPHTPLHDGGVIISRNRIVAAGCVFPLSQRTDVSKGLGTRHRAAIGLTEETDAVVVVVSEETGTVSVSYRGRLSRDLDADRLRRFLTAVLARGRRRKSPWKRAKEQLDFTPEGIAKSEVQNTKEGGDE